MSDKIDIPIQFMKNLFKKGTNFASDVWDVTKREGAETKIAVLILRKMIQGEDVTEGEMKFLKGHSMDIIKILPLVIISGIPIPIPITPLLILVGKRYGFDLLPKDNRHHLDNKSIRVKKRLK